MEPRLVTLSSYCDGAAEQLFQQALSKVLDNVDDINTDPKAKRQIVLSFSFEADEGNRHGVKVKLACVTKLAGIKQVQTYLHVGRHEGALAAVEALKQEEMFPQPAGKPALVEGA